MIAVLICLIPFPYLAHPEWEVWVVDEAGKPMEGITVRLIHDNYSLDEMGSKDLISDHSGHVRFDRG